MKLSTMASLYSSAIKTRYQNFPFLASSSCFPSSSSSHSLHNSTNFFSLRGSSSPAISMYSQKRNLSAVSCSISDNGFQDSSFQGGESFFRSVLASMESVYLNRNPTAKAVLELVHSVDGDQICYDHFAFRTFGVNGYGIDSMASFFLDFGYTPKEELRFPAKKLKAQWFSPPSTTVSENGSRAAGPFPRIFISELLVDQMSPETQEIIKKYTELSGSGNKHAALASALGSLTWGRPSYSEFQQLARESEYAAWTLVNGYAVNHVTISTHRLKSHLRDIKSLNQFIEESGFKLNSEGGNLKVSPDGLLLQSSTVADSTSFKFSNGTTELVPCSYIEFAERLVLPQYKNLPDNEVKEYHRRDGFEVGNADKIFESTFMEQLTRKAA
ncbi:2-oxoadipate dioxygenase/decarboxylase, chloroplastic [Ziziphus jujuba]|uniref:2-oxoadipate dioxygenase/decarboxylase n=1 Tax=Ziziphus jujuba TaxID=326968 RepID=A0A6P6GJA2_ZIZJJ|nr:2-oxoadipate dioxygenase/decarboxylase, chloroplastic [Ziziphus jujuba]